MLKLSHACSLLMFCMWFIIQLSSRVLFLKTEYRANATLGFLGTEPDEMWNERRRWSRAGLCCDASLSSNLPAKKLSHANFAGKSYTVKHIIPIHEFSATKNSCKIKFVGRNIFRQIFRNMHEFVANFSRDKSLGE